MKSSTLVWREKHIYGSQNVKHTILGPLLEVELSKKCTLLWREAHVEIKCTKHTRAGPLLEVELLRKCMQSTLTSQNAHSTPTSDHFWKLTCRKSAHRCGAKYVSKAKFQRTTCSDNFYGRSNVVLHGRRGDLAFVAVSETLAGLGHLEIIWKDAFCVASAVQETYSSGMLGGQGDDFLRRVAFWSIRSSSLLR